MAGRRHRLRSRSQKTYSAAQVAKHSTASSCWSIVGKSVYDLTKFIPFHSGGQVAPDTTLASFRIGALKS
ncbi:MAG: hypothetical protein HQ453_11520 [Actinobacteria bacterium]|nr:hypothetical protein [Actinomycetota bacterium]